jgi:uncharacterized protein YdgA (DUF945 family)
MNSLRFVIPAALGLVFMAGAAAQDLAKLVTKAEVEKVAGAKFKDPWRPMPSQIMFEQDGGDLQVSVDLEKRDATSTVRSWEATIKKMEPNAKVDTVAGVGKDAIYFSARADNGALSADFDNPRVQLRVAIAGAKSAAQAKQIVVDLAKIIGPRVGK